VPNRCGCANACSCLVVAGDGISVEGIGTLENPYEITSESSDLVGRVEFTDEGNVDFTATGVGTINDPLTVFGSAVMDLGDLSDVPDTEADDGDILVWRIDGWVYEQPAVVGPTLPPGGTDGQVLTKQSDLDGDADWETFAGGGGGGGAVMEPLVVGVYQRTTAYSATNTAGAIVVWDSVEQAAQGITYNSTTGQFTWAKSFDTFCPLGPEVVSLDEVDLAAGLPLETRVNGEVLQSASTSELLFDVPTLVAWISQGLTLDAGDIILTGTPSGVGFARDPQRWLQDGDVVEISIGGLGTLRNPVVRQ